MTSQALFETIACTFAVLASVLVAYRAGRVSGSCDERMRLWPLIRLYLSAETLVESARQHGVASDRFVEQMQHLREVVVDLKETKFLEPPG